MYAQPGEVTCPVKSYEKYISKLHPGIQDLWQRIRDSYNENDDRWYVKSPLGEKQSVQYDEQYFYNSWPIQKIYKPLYKSNLYFRT